MSTLDLSVLLLAVDVWLVVDWVSSLDMESASVSSSVLRLVDFCDSLVGSLDSLDSFMCWRVGTWLRYGFCIWFLFVFCSCWAAVHGNEVSWEVENFIRCKCWWSWNGGSIMCFHGWSRYGTSILVLGMWHRLIRVVWWSWKGLRLWGRDVTSGLEVVVYRAIGCWTVAWRGWAL